MTTQGAAMTLEFSVIVEKDEDGYYVAHAHALLVCAWACILNIHPSAR